MRQALLAAPDTIEIRDDARVPEPAGGDLRVRSQAVGICGSDLHALAGHHPFIDLPVVPGHEVAGVVDAVGDAVEGFAVGDRVLLEPNLVDGTCRQCRSGRYNLCEQLQVVGCTTDGALGEAFVAPAARFHRVPDRMTMTEAAMVEPLSTATHAVRVAEGVRDKTVAVLGAGTIGLLTMLTARAGGAVAVAITDPIQAKRAAAVELGADLAVDPTDGDAVERIRDGLPWRPDVVFDCVAAQASMDQAVALSLKGGTVVVEGVPRGAVQVPLPLIQDRELRIQGTAMYTRQDVDEAIALIAGGRVPAARLVTAEFPLERVAEAFDAARAGTEIKVHVHPQPAS
jgi:2-desacetyl-2-hydroxyethyl bacteriochlorophyllide A dehydrogenase